MPKLKSHKGLLKRIKITKSGKVRFGRPGSRHLKSNKTGEEIRGFRKKSYMRSGDKKRLKMLLHRPLLSQEEAMAAKVAREAAAESASA